LHQDGFIALDLAATPEIKKMLVGKKAIRSYAGDVSIILWFYFYLSSQMPEEHPSPLRVRTFSAS
jgi:hypothetical protein